MSSRHWALLAFFLTFISVFQNCGRLEPETAGSGVLSSQCISKIKDTRRKLRPATAPGQCESASLYACERHVFTPDVSDQEFTQEECFKSAHSNRVCLVVHSYYHNTINNRNLTHVEPSAFDPGGEFNRVEYSCYNLRIQVRGFAVFESEGSTLAEALEGAIHKCLGGPGDE
jgi:hypothetical protein